MKKTISLFLAFLFLLSAAGCAPKTDDAPDGDPSQDGMLQDAIAVTDHDSINGVAEAQRAGK